MPNRTVTTALTWASNYTNLKTINNKRNYERNKGTPCNQTHKTAITTTIYPTMIKKASPKFNHLPEIWKCEKEKKEKLSAKVNKMDVSLSGPRLIVGHLSIYENGQEQTVPHVIPSSLFWCHNIWCWSFCSLPPSPSQRARPPLRRDIRNGRIPYRPASSSNKTVFLIPNCCIHEFMRMREPNQAGIGWYVTLGKRVSSWHDSEGFMPRIRLSSNCLWIDGSIILYFVCLALGLFCLYIHSFGPRVGLGKWAYFSALSSSNMVFVCELLQTIGPGPYRWVGRFFGIYHHVNRWEYGL